MQFIVLQTLLKRIRAIPSYFRDRLVPLRRKILLAAGILYVLSPVDLVPEPVLLVGLIDDLVIFGFILYYLRDELDRYWLGEKPINPQVKFRGKKIIEGVDFTVKTPDTDQKEAAAGSKSEKPS